MSHAKGITELRACAEMAAMHARVADKMRTLLLDKNDERSAEYERLRDCYVREERGYLDELASFDVKVLKGMPSESRTEEDGA